MPSQWQGLKVLQLLTALTTLTECNRTLLGGPCNAIGNLDQCLVGSWRVMCDTCLWTDCNLLEVLSARNIGEIALTDYHWIGNLRSRPGKPNQRKGQNEKFMNFAHFCEFWCFSLGKQARFTLNFCSGMPLRKVHEPTFLWFGLPGPLLRIITQLIPKHFLCNSPTQEPPPSPFWQLTRTMVWVSPGRKLGPWSEFPFLYRFTVLLNSGGSNSPWSEFWSEFPHFMGMGVVPAPSSNHSGRVINYMVRN